MSGSRGYPPASGNRARGQGPRSPAGRDDPRYPASRDRSPVSVRQAPRAAADWEINPDAWYRAPPRRGASLPARYRPAGPPARTSHPGPRRANPARCPGPPPGRHRHPWVTIIALTLGLVVATYGLLRFGYSPHRHRGPAAQATSSETALRSHENLAFGYRTKYVGMAANPPISKRLPVIEQDLSGQKPGIMEIYFSFGGTIPFDQIFYLDKQHILPLVQINPKKQSLHEVAIGKYDGWITRLADGIRKLNAPVALSFAHEMNGYWYPWSVRQPTAQQVTNRPQFFRAAWRHVFKIFSQQHVTNVRWVWTVSRDAQRYGWPPLQAWWPGDKYVNWVGLNGYYRQPYETFDFLYKNQLDILRSFTRDPVLITETGVGPGPAQRRQIANLFAGVARTKGMLGFVWFDVNALEHWNIDGNRVAIAAFRRGMARYGY